MAVCQNLVPLVNIKIAGKWMFISLKMVLIGIDPYPNGPFSIAMLNYRRVTGNIRFTRGCPRSFQAHLGLVDENVSLATPKKIGTAISQLFQVPKNVGPPSYKLVYNPI